MKTFSCFTFLLLCVGAGAAPLIPADRLTPWTPGLYTGVLGGIPTNRAVYTNLALIDNTGATDVGAVINAALAAEASANKIVDLPAGRFRVDGQLILQTTRTLRGAGRTNTIILSGGGLRREVDNTGWGGMIYSAPLVTNGLTRGSTNIGLADTSAYGVGRMVSLARSSSTGQFDNPLVVTPGGTNLQYGFLYRSWFRVMAVTVSNLTIWPPLFDTWTNFDVRTYRSAPVHTRIGLESLTVHSFAQRGISWAGVSDSWIVDVGVTNSGNYNISLEDCVGIEIRDSRTDDLVPTPGSPNGAGLLMNTVSASLIENNIFMNAFPGLEINSGSCGNVFGYNFAFNTNGLVEFDSNHGSHNAFNLYEGNVTARFLADGYYGSVSQDTIFRNWLHGQVYTGSPNIAAALGYTVSLKRLTRDYSIVGNIIGSDSPHTASNDGTAFGQPFMGNDFNNGGFAPTWADWGIWGPSGEAFAELDTNVLNTLVRKGNFDFVTDTQESLGGDTLPSSLYLSAQPSWWYEDMPWPPVNPAAPGPYRTNIYALNTALIPAHYRWLTETNLPSGGGGEEGGSGLILHIGTIVVQP